jgi:methylisocitrate lyase
MHMHRTIGMAEAAGFAAIEIEDQLVPKRAHHHVGVEHMIPMELMAAKVREAVAARRSRDFLIVGRTNAVRAASMDEALRRGEAYRRAGADLVLLSMTHTAEQLRLIAERLGGPLMYLTGRGGLAALGMSLKDLGGLGYKIVADPSTPLWAACAAWKAVYAELADGFGARAPRSDWGAVEHEVLNVIDIETLLAVERATVEKGKA